MPSLGASNSKVIAAVSPRSKRAKLAYTDAYVRCYPRQVRCQAPHDGAVGREHDRGRTAPRSAAPVLTGLTKTPIYQ